MKKLLDELMQIWRGLTDENKRAVIEHARRLLVNQDIEKNRGD